MKTHPSMASSFRKSVRDISLRINSLVITIHSPALPSSFARSHFPILSFSHRRMASSQSPQVAPYGTWDSPISVETIAAKSINIQECAVSPLTKSIYFIEGRPAESGRSVVCYASSKSKSPSEVIPKDFSSRSTIHEYGGASFKPYPNKEAFVFTSLGAKPGVYQVNISEETDGKITASEPVSLVSGDAIHRYGNFAVHPKDCKLILAVMEDHTVDKPDKVVNTIVSIYGDPGNVEISTILKGKDFYTSPTWNADGTKVAWLQWDHPDMPWTGSEVCTADWAGGKLENVRIIAGKAGQESTSQPRWSPDGSLYYASDRSGFWQLYKCDEDGSSTHVHLPGLEEAEFSYAEWQLGWHSYDFLSPTKIVSSYVINATSKTILIDTSNNSYRDLGLPFVDTTASSVHAVSSSSFTIIASTSEQPPGLYLCNISDTRTDYTQIISSTPISIPSEIISFAQHISFPRISSPEPSTYAHAWYYAPQNPSYTAPDGSLPPLVISLHGGPTAHSTCGLALSIQYWTSRGYAYAFVNYSGSTGYGRQFRDCLNTQWGIADVSDAADCVHHLISQNLIDRARVGIVGGSAGGYGVLQAICSYPDIWAACVSNYGISSLKALVEDTHKFESKYMDKLLWHTDATDAEKEKILDERSPLLRAEKIRAPVLLLQGVDDKVVPKEQAEEMAKVIRNNGGVVEVVLFEGEGHGWRRQDTVVKALNLQEKWWRKYLVQA